MLLLGIETSCDETACALVEDGRRVVSSVLASSQDLFAKTGGVIPEEAARRQVECMIPVLRECLGATKWEDIDAIAVTKGPGLLGSLLVGATTARALSSLHGLPLIGVHHTLGHLTSPWLFENAEAPLAPRFPVLSLSASGGHTELWLRSSHTKGALLGSTRDDAAGEAFDKGALLLGLPYPGGPSIAKESRKGDPHAFLFPLPLREDASLDFSFSGLKTSLLYLTRQLGEGETLRRRADIAASFQEALCKHIVHRIEKAVRSHPGISEIHLTGGVSANTHLRERLGELTTENGLTLRWPQSLSSCTDNAAMIASAGYFLWKECGDRAFVPFETEASVQLRIEN